MEFTDPAVAVDTETNKEIPNFGASIFAQTPANTSALNFADAVLMRDSGG